jgi:hypothetical protein
VRYSGTTHNFGGNIQALSWPSQASIPEVTLPLPGICVTALKLRAERQARESSRSGSRSPPQQRQHRHGHHQLKIVRTVRSVLVHDTGPWDNVTPSMRTLGAEIARGRCGKSAVDRSLSEARSRSGDIAVFECCTALQYCQLGKPTNRGP